MKYLILAYTSARAWDEETVSEEDIERGCREYAAIEAELKENGEWLGSEGLADHSRTTTVAMGDRGVVTTDGPYLEAKETMVSYVLIDTSSHARAVEVATRLVEIAGQPCELRPVMDLELPEPA